jgi:ribosome-associated translation inhibitor RaiA
MKILIHMDKAIKVDGRQRDYFTSQITEELDSYQSHITKIEAHLSDQNGIKKGYDDIQCLLEAKLEGRQPVVVSNQADTAALAMSGALDKLNASLETILGRLQNHHQHNVE